MKDEYHIRRTPERRPRPTRVELANHYYKDAAALLKKYQLAWRSDEMDFQGIRSRRMKAYIDLLVALETLLKAIICLRAPYHKAGQELVAYVRGFNHGIPALTDVALRNLKMQDATVLLNSCNKAPITFRYDFDAETARELDQKAYYDTVGSNEWLTALEKFVSDGVTRLGKVLSRRSKIVDARVVLEEILHRK